MAGRGVIKLIIRDVIELIIKRSIIKLIKRRSDIELLKGSVIELIKRWGVIKRRTILRFDCL